MSIKLKNGATVRTKAVKRMFALQAMSAVPEPEMPIDDSGLPNPLDPSYNAQKRLHPLEKAAAIDRALLLLGIDSIELPDGFEGQAPDDREFVSDMNSLNFDVETKKQRNFLWVYMFSSEEKQDAILRSIRKKSGMLAEEDVQGK